MKIATLEDLVNIIHEINKEVGSGPPHETIKNIVEVRDIDTDEHFIIEAINPIENLGCGCWLGAEILIKKQPK